MRTTAIALVLLLQIGCILPADDSTARTPEKKGHKKESKSHNAKNNEGAPAGVSVLASWSLPPELVEISGHALIDAERVACVQDEEGKIFIYNRSRKAVEQVVPFADAGDYEGITLAGGTAWVIRADGTLFEVADYRSGKPRVRSYATGLTVDQNIEGLCYDAKKSRLLLAVKDREPGDPGYKGIYAFDPATGRMAATPVYKISLTDPLLQGNSGKKKKKGGIRPSAIGIHPATGVLYVVDGPGARLFTVSGGGALETVYHLGDAFPKAEGIAFSNEGALFISSEGVKGQAIIAQVDLEPGALPAAR